MKTPNNVYRRFVEFEEKAAGIYLKLASHFAERNRELSALWLRMAVEEKQHAALLQFCKAERLFAANLPTDSDIIKFSELFRNLKKQAGSPTVDVNEAFSLACELEGSEVNAIYCYLTTPLHKSIYLLRRKIVLSPSNHIDRLITAGKEFGINSRTLKKLERLRELCPATCF